MITILLAVGVLAALALALVPGEDDDDQAGAGAQGTGDDTQDTAGAGTGAGANAGALTQEQVDKIVADRLARAERKAEAQRAELQAKVDGYERAEEERKAAEMSEVEKAQKAASEAKAEAEAARAEAAAERVRALRADLISQHAADLPPAYKAQVAGTTDEEITESIATARAAYEADRGNVSAAVVQELLTLTPEQVADKYGEAGKALAGRLAGRPVSVGSPSNAGGGGGSVPGTFDPNKPDPAAWARQREAEGYAPLPGAKPA